MNNFSFFFSKNLVEQILLSTTSIDNIVLLSLGAPTIIKKKDPTFDGW